MTLPIVIIVCVILLFVLIVYNGLVRKRNQVKQSRSSIDVYLTQRFDLIPNLVEVVKGYAAHEKSLFEETVKGYAKHEKGTLEDVVKARNTYLSANTVEEKGAADKEMTSALNKLFALAESYPELKASDNFLNLQKNLTKMEDQLQAARRLYNTDVTTYNTALQTFPSNMIAGLFGFKAEELFQLEPGKEGPVKVEL